MRRTLLTTLLTGMMLVIVPMGAMAGEQKYVTGWVSSSEFQAIFNRMADNRYYTYYVEGRTEGGAIQYRGEFRPLFANLKSWYSFHGMSDEWYERRKAAFGVVGYRELYHTSFLDLSGQSVHQACWIEIFESSEPAQPSPASPEKATSL